MDKNGLLLCARYAASPNFFRFCGPDKNKSLIDHLKEGVADSEVEHNLVEFETLYSYLQLIARENKIEDPFGPQAVEAYWIGNSLLNNIKNSQYLSFLQEKLSIEKKISKDKLIKLKTNLSKTLFLPNHAFHVFNIFKNMRKDINSQTLDTMDQCRISWGQIQKSQIHNLNVKTIIVNTKPLFCDRGKLLLGQTIIKEVKIDYKGKTFINNLQVGDWVSFHWGIVCDKITAQQVKRLEFYTQKAIDFYNS